MFIRLLIIGDQQQINVMARQLMADLPDHLEKNVIVERRGADREDETNGIDGAHFQTAGESVGAIAPALRFSLNPGAGLLRHIVVAVQRPADGRDGDPKVVWQWLFSDIKIPVFA